MLKNITIPKKLKPVLLLLSIVFLAYQTAIVVPNMLTVSLGTWVNTIASILPGFIVVILLAAWNSPEKTIDLWRPKFPQIKDLFTIRMIVFLLPFGIFLGLMTLWTISHYELFNIVGQAIVFGSMIAMLVIGLIKPELGPVAFFVLYSALMFSEARVFGWGWLVEVIQNTPEWLETTLFGLFNIDITMLFFTIGFLLFLIGYAQKIGKTMLDKPIMIFLLWTAISVITANDPLEGLRSYLIRWVSPVVMYYATIFAMKRPNGIREIKISLMVLLFLSCLLSIQNALLSKEQVTFVDTERSKIWTVIGGQMGPWTVLIIPLTVNLLFDKREAMYIRALSILTTILSFIMAVWEMQRTVILGFFIMLVLHAILYHNKRWRFLIMYIVLGTVVFLSFDKIMSVIEILRPSVSHGNPFAPSANLDRLYLWEKGLEIVKDNPVFGIGPGGFVLLKIGLNFPEVSSHIMFLDIAIESGIIASIIYAAILFIPIFKFSISFYKDTYRIYKCDLRPWIISLMVFCYVHHMFHANWDWGYGLAVFCMLGVVVGTMRNAVSLAQSARSIGHSA